MVVAGGRSGPDKEGVARLSSMQKKVLALGLAGISVGSFAAVSVGVRPSHVAKLIPAAMQSAALPAQYPQSAPPPSYAMPPALSSAVAQWNSLRQTDSLPFSSYASFLLTHPGWPGEASMRRTASKRERSRPA